MAASIEVPRSFAQQYFFIPMPRTRAALAGVLVIACAGMSAAPDVSAEGIASLDAITDAESERLATLGRIWHSVTRDALPELEPDQVGVTTPTLWGDEFFRLRASRGCVDWGVPRPPLRLTGFIVPRHRKPVAASGRRSDYAGRAAALGGATRPVCDRCARARRVQRSDLATNFRLHATRGHTRAA